MDEIKNYIASVKSEAENRPMSGSISSRASKALERAVHVLERSIINKEPYFMRFSNVRKYIQEETKKYSSGEISLMPVLLEHLQYYLFQLVYFGFSPDLLPIDDLERLGIIDQYFRWEYLNNNRRELWTQKVITKENFSEGFSSNRHLSRRNKELVWTNRHLNAFFLSFILPDLMEITGIKIDIAEVRVYSYSHNYAKFSNEIKDFLNRKVCEGISSIRSLQGNEILERIKNRRGGCLFETIMLNLKWRQYKKEQTLKKSLENAMKKLTEKKITTRFKWQDICAELSKIRLNELQDLAFIEKIPHYLLMTKKELCVEFAKKYESTIMIVSKVQPMCINTTSILGTDVNEISPEFFYSYQHNGKVFCDDIRDLNKHFYINGPKHPIDRSIVDKRLVDNVKEWLKYLTKITRTMEDFEEEEIPTKSLLTSKSATLASVLNYPNSISLFINSSSIQLTKFLNLLQEENIISSNDKSSLNKINSLDSKKTLLVDLLLMKILNDPEQETVNGNLISTVQINLSNIYNNVFT
jgi:hypothetical protein